MKKFLTLLYLSALVASTHIEAKRWLNLKNQTGIPDQALSLELWKN